MGAHASFLAWRIPWTEEPVSYDPQGCKESDTMEATKHAGKRQRNLSSKVFPFLLPY